MAVSGWGSALMKSLDLMGWVFGSSLDVDGRSFLDSRQVIALRSVFSTSCGVKNGPLRQRS